MLWSRTASVSPVCQTDLANRAVLASSSHSAPSPMPTNSMDAESARIAVAMNAFCLGIFDRPSPYFPAPRRRHQE